MTGVLPRIRRHAQRALVVHPDGPAGARLESAFPDPPEEDGSVVVRTISVGICGTDRDIARGAFGSAPRGQRALVLGHEVLGRVVTAPDDVPLRAGQLVTALVRRPCPERCRSCRAGRWDLCRTGQFTESGITGRHGFLREHFRSEPAALVPVPDDLLRIGTLVEPASVVCKAWSQIDALAAAGLGDGLVLVTGGGPIGLLALLLARQRGRAAVLLTRPQHQRARALAAAIGADVHTGPVDGLPQRPDVVIEATGDTGLVRDVLDAAAPGSVVCLLGVTHATGSPVGVGALNDALVHANITVMGSVNARVQDHRDAALSLAAAPTGWVEQLITRRVPLEDAGRALAGGHGGIKTVVDVAGPL